MRWFERQRIEWIAETLRIFGFINREHLERKFGVSTPQASLDLSRFQELHPNTMTYDLSAKRYVAREPVTDLCVVLSEENDRLIDEVARLNQWAEGFSEAQLKERRLCEERLKELQQQIDKRTLALMMIREGCADPAKFAGERIAALSALTPCQHSEAKS